MVLNVHRLWRWLRVKAGASRLLRRMQGYPDPDIGQAINQEVAGLVNALVAMVTPDLVREANDNAWGVRSEEFAYFLTGMGYPSTPVGVPGSALVFLEVPSSGGEGGNRTSTSRQLAQ